MSTPSNVDQITCPRNSLERQSAPLPPKRMSSLMPKSPGIATKDTFSQNAQPPSTSAQMSTFSAPRRPTRPSTEMFQEQPSTKEISKRYSQPVPITSDDPYRLKTQPRSTAAELSTFSAPRRHARPSSEMFSQQASEIRTLKRYSHPVPPPRIPVLLKENQQPTTSESPGSFANVPASGTRFSTPPKRYRPPTAATEKEQSSTPKSTDLERFHFHPVINSPKHSSAFFEASRQSHASRYSQLASDDDLDSTFDTSDTSIDSYIIPSSPQPPAPPSPFIPRAPETFLHKTLGSTPSLNPFAKPGPIDPYVGSSLVVGLTKSTFKPFLRDVDAALVLFYDPWNKDCKWAKMNMREAANITQRENHVFAAVDCTIESKLCRQQKITVFPTMKLFAQGKTVSTYLDESFLSSQQMASFVEQTPAVSTGLSTVKECVVQ